MTQLSRPAQRAVAAALRGPRLSHHALASARSTLASAGPPALAQRRLQSLSAQTAQSRAADWLSQWQRSRGQEQVQVSEHRLEEMLRAEVECLAQETSNKICLQSLLESSTASKVAQPLHSELSKIFASQILRLERTTPQWKTVPGIFEAHRVFSRSFRKLRLADPNDPASFGALIRNIQAQDKLLVPLYTQIAHHLEDTCIMNNAEVDAWMFGLLNSRIGVEMAMDHYIRLLSSPCGSHVGIVHTRCDPGKVCQEAIEELRAEFPEAVLDFKVHVEQSSIGFSFPSDYLYLIVEELLRNGARATQLKAQQDPMQPPADIELTICACPDRVAIKISDRGGGATPASGCGTGLPFCELYTQQLGGSLHAMSRPGVGTDVFVYLPRISVDSLSA